MQAACRTSDVELGYEDRDGRLQRGLEQRYSIVAFSSELGAAHGEVKPFEAKTRDTGAPAGGDED